jgi:hypothetical protein
LVISILLYFLLFHLLLPLYRRHRARYSEYLPLGIAASSSTSPSNLRGRISDALHSFLPTFRLAENWLLPGRARVFSAADDEAGDEELEEAVWDGNDGGHHPEPRTEDRQRRLSRHLEEGFRDSSDDES